ARRSRLCRSRCPSSTPGRSVGSNGPRPSPRPRPPAPRRTSCGLLRRLSQLRRDLAHDGDRDLGGRDRANVETDGSMDARERGIGQALRPEPLDAAPVGLLRTERADIEAVTRKRMGERGVVDLGVVGERDEGGIAIDAERRQRDIGPLRDHLHVGKTLDRGKGRARIDDGHIVAEKPRDRGERLADVHGASDNELRRRNVHGEEDLACRGLRHAALATADVLFDYVLQRIARHVRGLDQPLLAARHIGDHDRGATRHAFGVEGSKDVEFHVRSPRVANGEKRLVTSKGYSPFAPRPTPPSPHRPGWCRHRRARPSRRSRRRHRIRASWAFRSRSRRALRSPPRPRRSRPRRCRGNCPDRRSPSSNPPAAAPSPRSRPRSRARPRVLSPASPLPPAGSLHRARTFAPPPSRSSSTGLAPRAVILFDAFRWIAGARPAMTITPPCPTKPLDRRRGRPWPRARAPGPPWIADCGSAAIRQHAATWSECPWPWPRNP